MSDSDTDYDLILWQEEFPGSEDLINVGEGDLGNGVTENVSYVATASKLGYYEWEIQYFNGDTYDFDYCAPIDLIPPAVTINVPSGWFGIKWIESTSFTIELSAADPDFSGNGTGSGVASGDLDYEIDESGTPLDLATTTSDYDFTLGQHNKRFDFHFRATDNVEFTSEFVSDYVEIDTVDPSIFFTTVPDDNDVVFGISVPLNSTASDDINIYVHEILIDSTLLNDTTSNNNAVVWNTEGTDDGPVFIYAFVYDNAGNFDADLRNVFVDNDPPEVNITSLSTAECVRGAAVIVAFTAVEDTLAVVDPYVLYVDNFFVADGNSLSFNWNSTSEFDGSYEIKVEAYSRDDHLVGSHTVDIIIDNTNPTVVFVTSPPPVVSGFSTQIEGLATDANFLLESHVIVGGEQRTSNDLVFDWNSTTESDGPIIVELFAEDCAGNQATTSLSVIVDNLEPSITSNLEMEGADCLSGSVRIEIIAEDPSGFASSEPFSFFIDGISVQSGSDPFYDWDTSTYTGSFPVEITMIATSIGGRNAVHTVTVEGFDTAAPTVSFTNAPADNSAVDGLEQVVMDATDDIGITEGQFLILNQGTGDVFLETFPAFPHTFEWNTLDVAFPDGFYAIEVSTIDCANNIAFESRNIRVDNEPPDVAIVSPNDGSPILVSNNDPIVNIDWTAVDATFLQLVDAFTIKIKTDEIERINVDLDVSNYSLDSNVLEVFPGTPFEGNVEVEVLARSELGKLESRQITFLLNRVPAKVSVPSISDPGTGTSLDLVWAANSEADIVTYRVYEQSVGIAGPTSGYTTVSASSPTISYTANALVSGVRYSYRISAVDIFEEEGELSDVVFETPKDGVAPLTPTSFVAIAGDGEVRLTWGGNGENDIKHYVIVRDAGAGPFSIDTTPGTNFTDTEVTNGTAYSYQIIAVDTSNNMSSPTSFMQVTPESLTPPLPPTGIVANAGPQQIAISWDENDPIVTGYNVFMATNEGGPFVQQNTALITTTTFSTVEFFNGTTFDSLDNGVEYFIYLTAFDDNRPLGSKDSQQSVLHSATPGIEVLLIEDVMPIDGSGNLSVIDPYNTDVSVTDVYSKIRYSLIRTVDSVTIEVVDKESEAIVYSENIKVPHDSAVAPIITYPAFTWGGKYTNTQSLGASVPPGLYEIRLTAHEGIIETPKIWTGSVSILGPNVLFLGVDPESIENGGDAPTTFFLADGESEIKIFAELRNDQGIPMVSNLEVEFMIDESDLTYLHFKTDPVGEDVLKRASIFTDENPLKLLQIDVSLQSILATADANAISNGDITIRANVRGWPDSMATTVRLGGSRILVSALPEQPPFKRGFDIGALQKKLRSIRYLTSDNFVPGVNNVYDRWITAGAYSLTADELGNFYNANRRLKGWRNIVDDRPMMDGPFDNDTIIERLNAHAAQYKIAQQRYPEVVGSGHAQFGTWLSNAAFILQPLSVATVTKENFLRALVQQESSGQHFLNNESIIIGKPNKTSTPIPVIHLFTEGALGFLQLMPFSTATRNLYDPEENLITGAEVLNTRLDVISTINETGGSCIGSCNADCDSDDGWGRLSKVITSYNGGLFGSDQAAVVSTWPNMLAGNTNMKITAICYSIQVKQRMGVPLTPCEEAWQEDDVHNCAVRTP